MYRIEDFDASWARIAHEVGDRGGDLAASHRRAAGHDPPAGTGTGTGTGGGGGGYVNHASHGDPHGVAAAARAYLGLPEQVRPI